MKNYKVAVIAGDGIGKEVMPEGLEYLKLLPKNIISHYR